MPEIRIKGTGKLSVTRVKTTKMKAKPKKTAAPKKKTTTRRRKRK